MNFQAYTHGPSVQRRVTMKLPHSTELTDNDRLHAVVESYEDIICELVDDYEMRIEDLKKNRHAAGMSDERIINSIMVLTNPNKAHIPSISGGLVTWFPVVCDKRVEAKLILHAVVEYINEKYSISTIDILVTTTVRLGIQAWGPVEFNEIMRMYTLCFIAARATFEWFESTNNLGMGTNGVSMSSVADQELCVAFFTTFCKFVIEALVIHLANTNRIAVIPVMDALWNGPMGIFRLSRMSYNNGIDSLVLTSAASVWHMFDKHSLDVILGNTGMFIRRYEGGEIFSDIPKDQLFRKIVNQAHRRNLGCWYNALACESSFDIYKTSPFTKMGPEFPYYLEYCKIMVAQTKYDTYWERIVNCANDVILRMEEKVIAENLVVGSRVEPIFTTTQAEELGTDAQPAELMTPEGSTFSIVY